ncbi:MAG: AmmeMemoRadiSam system radical SAM enzyme [bacterium]|nr:AmmeMemoRadiSam system radical SAM enzyme [bacterium]
MPTLADIIDPLTEVRDELVIPKDDKALTCLACGHRCFIKEGRRGICKVRYNEGGELKVPTGYIGALNCDPTEKKPFFHMLPGSATMTFGMLGCDYHCGYCQNWLTSQALRDPNAVAPTQPTTPEILVRIAREKGARIVGSSYNEPLITAEWARDIFDVAKASGLKTCFISNGNATREVLEYLRPVTDGYKVDLKSMQDKSYRRLGGVLQVVLDAIPMLVEMGFWVEVVTLLIPGFNDSEEEIREAASYLAGVSPDIPWHVTAFHKDYKMTDPDDTPASTLIRATEIGYEEGLHYVYAGNRPGQVGSLEDTRCHGCGTTLIRRVGFHVRDQRVGPDGRCPKCATAIPGIWS